MTRTILLITMLFGIALVISISARQSNSSYSKINQDQSQARIHCNTSDVDMKSETATGITLEGATIFSTGELKHYLCALEVKRRITSDMIIEESAVACTKTIPEYLAEPSCK